MAMRRCLPARAGRESHLRAPLRVGHLLFSQSHPPNGLIGCQSLVITVGVAVNPARFRERKIELPSRDASCPIVVVGQFERAPTVIPSIRTSAARNLPMIAEEDPFAPEVAMLRMTRLGARFETDPLPQLS